MYDSTNPELELKVTLMINIHFSRFKENIKIFGEIILYAFYFEERVK